MGVIGREYGHMIENRMIGKGFRRGGVHAGAMGEAFGDLNAIEYLNENQGRGPDRDGDNNDKRGDDNGAGYNFVANAPGYGHVRFRIDDLRPGEKRTVTIEFGNDVASATNGATATGDGTALQSLIDDTEATQWTSTGTTDVAGRQVAIALNGRQSFTAVSVSALRGPGQNRFTALRSFEIWSCDAGKSKDNPTCDASNTAGWKKVLWSESNAFPSVNPRPIASDMQLRTWDVPKTTATNVLRRRRQPLAPSEPRGRPRAGPRTSGVGEAAELHQHALEARGRVGALFDPDGPAAVRDAVDEPVRDRRLRLVALGERREPRLPQRRLERAQPRRGQSRRLQR
jgi:hypothetical protein